jgi:hypothetical protein
MENADALLDREEGPMRGLSFAVYAEILPLGVSFRVFRPGVL